MLSKIRFKFQRFLLGTSPSPRVTLEEFEGGYAICFLTLLSIFHFYVSFPTTLNSFSHETNEQPIPATRFRDHKALPYVRAKWLEFNFKVVKTTLPLLFFPVNLNHYLPSALFGPLALTLPPS